MKYRALSCLSIAGVLVIAGSGTAQAEADQPPAEHTPYVTAPGFSVLPPPGEGWVRLSSEALQRLNLAYRIGYSKSSGSASRSMIGVGTITLPSVAGPPEAALETIVHSRHQVEQEQARNSNRLRIIAAASTATARNGATCWREDELAEDRGVPGHEGEVFTLVRHRLLCLHPEFAGLLIVADCSRRLAPDQAPSAADNEGEAVLQSLAFQSFGKRITTIAVGEKVQGIAGTPGAIWVAYGRNRGGVAHIDPRDNRVIATIATGKWPIGAAADETSVWIANTGDDTVTRIDPATDKVVATIPVGRQPLQIALGAGAAWVSNSGDASVSRIDLLTNKATSIPNIAGMPAGIALAGGVVLVTDYDSDQIIRIDAKTGGVLGKMAAGRQSNTLLAVGDEVWVNDQPNRAILRLSAGQPEQAPHKFNAGIGVQPTGLAREGNDLWVANWADSTLTVVDVQEPLGHSRTIPTGLHPFAILAAEGAIWVTDVDDGSVLRLDPR